MSADPSIPMMRSPAHVMARGPNGDNLAAQARQIHPVDRMQRASAASGTSSALDLDAIRRLYGSALAMRLSTERRLASGVGGRLPGMDAAPDSRAMLDALTGDDLTMDFGDFLGLPENRPEDAMGKGAGNGPVVDAGPHAAMEARLGL
eukprot:CAMPEP_0197435752 /NCGR_PEP_ID=MMETSP1175-20131217/3288_1 /TAXON_ID=1003142 /ORGANISM="Triceratium dubium, Strain CCMP147" /LENGTH=147 /DNA_ID=CAMNT_0042964865 /DNA_START=151 /DNA_END=594 /DNA_ORIENTATION=-